MNDKILELEQKLAQLQGAEQTNSVWSLLDSQTKDLTPQDIETINANKSVRVNRQKMLDVFINMFLLSKYRNEFANIPAYRTLCEAYVNAVIKAKQDIAQHNADLEAENKKLKEELAKLKGVSNE